MCVGRRVMQLEHTCTLGLQGLVHSVSSNVQREAKADHRIHRLRVVQSDLPERRKFLAICPDVLLVHFISYDGNSSGSTHLQ